HLTGQASQPRGQPIPKPSENPMSTQPTPVTAPRAEDEREIRIISHSNLFYWWPVWAVGYLLGIMTLFGDHKVAIVPKDEAKWKGVYEKVGNSWEEHEGVIFSEKGEASAQSKDRKATEVDRPHLLMAGRSTYGVLFATVLLLVIVITNVPLRGL